MLKFVKPYAAIFEPIEGGGGYGVYFPHLPGLGTVGDTYEDAVNMAKEALNIYLADMIDEGKSLPLFDLAEVFEEAKKVNGIVAFVEPDKWQLIDMMERPLTKRVNITILESVLEMADKAAKKIGTSRSALIERGLRAVI